jgi:hypothetical protein
MDDIDRAARRAEVYAGQRMGEFLHDDLMQEHFNNLLHGYQNMWLEAQTIEDREMLWMRTRALRDFIESLQSVITTGEMASIQLSEDQNDQ